MNIPLESKLLISFPYISHRSISVDSKHSIWICTTHRCGLKEEDEKERQEE